MHRAIQTIRALPSFVIGVIIFRFFGGVAAARYKGVKVGNDCRIYIKQFGTEPFLISIGDRVTITSGVKIITHDGSTALVHDNMGRRYFHYAPVSIGNDVFVGIDSIILPGITIGSNVVIGAGSIVTRDIPDNCVAVGNPAKVIGSFETFRSRIINNHVNESDLNTLSGYRERVSKAVDFKRCAKK